MRLSVTRPRVLRIVGCSVWPTALLGLQITFWIKTSGEKWDRKCNANGCNMQNDAFHLYHGRAHWRHHKCSGAPVFVQLHSSTFPGSMKTIFANPQARYLVGVRLSATGILEAFTLNHSGSPSYLIPIRGWRASWQRHDWPKIVWREPCPCCWQMLLSIGPSSPRE